MHSASAYRYSGELPRVAPYWLHESTSVLAALESAMTFVSRHTHGPIYVRVDGNIYRYRLDIRSNVTRGYTRGFVVEP